MGKYTQQKMGMDVYGMSAISLDEVEKLIGRIFETWPPSKRDARWLKAYTRAASTFAAWEQQLQEVAQQVARDADANERARLAQSRTRKLRLSEEGATRVGGGRHALAGDSLADDICAVHLAAVDAMLQEAHAKGRGKGGDET